MVSNCNSPCHSAYYISIFCRARAIRDANEYVVFVCVSDKIVVHCSDRAESAIQQKCVVLHICTRWPYSKATTPFCRAVFTKYGAYCLHCIRLCRWSVALLVYKQILTSISACHTCGLFAVCVWIRKVTENKYSVYLTYICIRCTETLLKDNNYDLPD